MPPTIWEDWRTWIYYFAEDEGDVPLGREGSSVSMLEIKTHGGSSAVANPSFRKLSCPGSNDETPKCIFVAYFIFGEGAAPGESGVLAFTKKLPESM